jgi:hypothetical protein
VQQKNQKKFGLFLGATDLTESPQTNRMRYHETGFCIQLETKNAQAKNF